MRVGNDSLTLLLTGKACESKIIAVLSIIGFSKRKKVKKCINKKKGFLVDDDFNIYSARTGLKLTSSKGSDGYM